MRILLYGLNYHPEPTGAGKTTGMMAEWLAEQGHHVRVVTAPPYYPEWKVAKPYRSGAYKRETHAGVCIWRCPLWVPSRQTGWRRVLHLGSFALSSLPVLAVQAFWRPRVVMVIAPTLLTAPAGWLLGRYCGALTWLNIKDFEVDAAFDMKLLRGSALRRWVLAAEAVLLRRFDRVSSISTAMVDRLVEKGVPRERAVKIPDWVEVGTIFPDPEAGARMRERLGLNAGQIIVLYSGNLGEKQGLDILIGAARRLQSRTEIAFLICGAGGYREQLVVASKELTNLIVTPLQPVELLNALLNAADIHVLPQRPEAADLVLPSKLLFMMASGRCVVATAADDTEVGRILTASGNLVTPPGDAAGLAAGIEALASDATARSAAGSRARGYAVEFLAKERVLEGVVQILENCAMH